MVNGYKKEDNTSCPSNFLKHPKTTSTITSNYHSTHEAGSISNMSSPTQPAFVMRDDWNDESRNHPAMKWMEDYTRMFDQRGYNQEKWTDWFTEDMVLTKADGSVHKGEAAWEASKEVYSAFTEYMHLPYFCVTIDTDDGWEMVGQAHIYGNLPGQRGEGEPPKVKDSRDGKEWEVRIPGAFRFHYVKGKGKHGMALSATDLHGDSMPVGMTLIKRGVIKMG